MPAIATDPLKLKFARLLFDEVSNTADSHEYYIGIGKSDTYDSSDTTATPVRSLQEERELRNNLQSVKQVTSSSFVIPRYNWTSGGIYSAWSDASVGIPVNSYYVLTEDNEVYICLQQGKSATGAANTSIVKPSFTDAAVAQTEAFETSDGYRWKLAYAVSASRANTFLSSGYIPCQINTVDSSVANAFELQQLRVEEAAVGGQIVGVEITGGGSGYTTAPTITFAGNGTGASATATISGGAIVKVEMANESAGMGSGYDYASATVTGNASLRPIIGPKLGIGKDARADLKSSSIMFNVKTTGTETDTFGITNDFRQISLFRNLEETDSDAIYSQSTGRANRKLTLTTTVSASGFAVDEKITNSAGISAFIDELDSSNGYTIFYHQNSNNVAGDFADGDTLTGSLSGSGTIDSADINNIVDAHSGELFYIENRARVIRSSAQTEDIKVIITV